MCITAIIMFCCWLYKNELILYMVLLFTVSFFKIILNDLFVSKHLIFLYYSPLFLNISCATHYCYMTTFAVTILFTVTKTFNLVNNHFCLTPIFAIMTAIAKSTTKYSMIYKMLLRITNQTVSLCLPKLIFRYNERYPQSFTSYLGN